METQPEVAQPMSHTQIVDLRRRVLAGELVSDEELRDAIVAMSRSAPEHIIKPKKTGPTVTIDVMALLKANVAKSKTENEPK